MPEDMMADSGWTTPDMADMMLKMCSWLPDIHIMKASSPMLLNAPVALPTSACVHAANRECWCCTGLDVACSRAVPWSYVIMEEVCCSAFKWLFGERRH